MSIGHLYVLCGEVSIQVLYPFFNWVVCFFGVEWKGKLKRKKYIVCNLLVILSPISCREKPMEMVDLYTTNKQTNK